MGHLVALGLNHHTTPLDVRERLAFDDARWREVAPASPPTVLLSTCNRVEVYAWVEGPSRPAIGKLTRALAKAGNIRPADLRPHLVARTGSQAVLHLVRVAAGLDSLVVGEDQIRGQVRDALRRAEAAGQLPAQLRGVFHRAAQAVRQVRAETQLGHHPSIATAGIHVASRLPEVGDLSQGASVVVLGAGVMAKAAARHLAVELGARVVLLNRTPSHAELVAAEIPAPLRVGALSDATLIEELRDAALLIGATASREPVVSIDLLERAVAARGGRPLVVLDIAVPRDVDPGARQVEGVRLVDLDDLERLCPVDARGRHAELERAEALAAAEAERIGKWLRVRAVSPAIVELRQFGELVRTGELRRSAARLKDLTPEELAAVDALTAGIVNKLLHGPTLALRDSAGLPGSLSRSRSLVLERVLRLNHNRDETAKSRSRTGGRNAW
jgi:glutamyl-tRNA reductase